MEMVGPGDGDSDSPEARSKEEALELVTPIWAAFCSRAVADMAAGWSDGE